MSSALLRAGEDVSGFIIGEFGDRRLTKIGALFFKRLFERLTICIKSLGGNRATEVAFSRFLSNENVTPEQISDELAKKTNESCLGKSHVLCIQDTGELTYPTQPLKKERLGSTSHAGTKGLLVHPGIIVDATNRDVLGMSSIMTWSRDNTAVNSKNKSRPIEEKESIRWINTALLAKERISHAEQITIVGDRESDILDLFEQVPDERTHVLVRASHDRMLDTDEKLTERLADTNVMGTYEIELPSITGKRKARVAKLAIKYTPITLRSGEKEALTIFCVSALEVSSVPKGESPISWVLLTTHVVNSLKKAIQILTWYTWRWIIEQVFRTMKNKGLKVEESQIEEPKKLQVLSILCVATAIKVMSLVESREGRNNRNAADLFMEEELILLSLIWKKLEGKTQKQKNPHLENSMAWASWIIARLGGWNGYRSESPPGPVVMLRGLQKFEMQYEGWLLAQ